MTPTWNEEGGAALAAAASAALGRPVAHYLEDCGRIGSTQWLWPAELEDADAQAAYAIGFHAPYGMPGARIVLPGCGSVGRVFSAEDAVAQAVRHMQPRAFSADGPLPDRILEVLRHFAAPPGGRPLGVWELARHLGADPGETWAEVRRLKSAGLVCERGGRPDMPMRRTATPYYDAGLLAPAEPVPAAAGEAEDVIARALRSVTPRGAPPPYRRIVSARMDHGRREEGQHSRWAAVGELEMADGLPATVRVSLWAAYDDAWSIRWSNIVGGPLGYDRQAGAWTRRPPVAEAA